MAGALIGFTPSDVEASNLFDYNNLGSGAELRSELMEKNHSGINSDHIMYHPETYKMDDMKCGGEEKKSKKSKKEAKAAEDKTSESKCGEGKCGEGKCGGDDKSKKSDTTDTKMAEDKTSESKCGEGKCGN